MLDKKTIATNYYNQAKTMATSCVTRASDGNSHSRLEYDLSNTWSQKYNLVWDKVLNLNIFPSTFAPTEISYYQTKLNTYGLPLDNRKAYTKSDWSVWTATLAGDKTTFEKFIDPMYNFFNETTDRVPMSDWYNTDSKTKVGFQARSVVGGYFMKMLEVNIPQGIDNNLVNKEISVNYQNNEIEVLSNGHKLPYQLKLYNEVGTLLLLRSIDDTEAKINVSTLLRGSVIYKLDTKTENIQSGKLVLN